LRLPVSSKAKEVTLLEESAILVEGPEPLCDIFYLLQCIIPGILTITREEDPDREQWLQKYQGVLKEHL